jgi:CheY-like chemotaxis protein
MVVDDDPAIRAVVGEILEAEGYRVEMAKNGQQALVKVGSTRPDAILLDLMMPVMDGWTFLLKLRTDPLRIDRRSR